MSTTTTTRGGGHHQARPRDLQEAAALAALERAAGAAGQFERHVEEAANALAGIDDDQVRAAHRVLELHKLATVRLAAVVRRLAEAEGAP